MATARRLLDDLVASASPLPWHFEKIEAWPATAAILEADPPTQIAMVRECIDRVARMRDRLGRPRGKDVRLRYMNLYHEVGFPRESWLIVARLLRRKLPWTSEDLAYLVNRTADLGMVSTFSLRFLPSLVSVVQRALKTCPMTDELRRGLGRLQKATEWRSYRAKERRLCEQLSTLAES
jgi:hypothetical protein